jgi:diguanylate cyclase (GGDEF)-like protein
MIFDIRSAMLITSLLTLCVSASLWFAASRYPDHLRRTMRIWIGGLLLQMIALASAAIRGPHSSAALMIIATNAIYALSYAEMGRAMNEFAGRRPSWLPLALVGVFVLVLVLFTMVWPSPRWRVTFDTAPLVALQLGVALSVLRGRDALRPADWLTGSLFVGCAILALARGVAEFLGPPLVSAEVRLGVLYTVLVFSSILPTIGTVGFMLMCGDRMNDDLSRLAMLDPLTGVYNRRTLATFAAESIDAARRTQRPLALLAIDVDHFKEINDACGHDTGDEALVALVRLMRESLGEESQLSRIGGEEFAVLLRDTGEQAALGVAERMRRHVAASPLALGRHSLKVTVSIGVATTSREVGTLRDLLRNADRALYAAKHAGRNRCVTWSSLMQAAPGVLAASVE